ncbi:MAG: MerR family transcriptional regulator [Candidatus Omnitrophota bacterium]|jgi:DNA-binding transcriptional MerR regulator|nr:MAG: MerR family transcriptional regulator [Candidatus Omnitrophota bacterium]
MAMNIKEKPQPIPVDQIPQKIFYSISEASEYTGVEPHVLRYWETKFPRLNPKRVGGNQRKYTRNDIDLLYEIVHLLYDEGYTLDGAERRLRAGLQNLKSEREADKEKKNIKEAEKSPLPSVPEKKTNRRNGLLLKEIKTELKTILSLLE